MLFKSMDFIKRLIIEDAGELEGSLAITDPKVLDKYINDPSFPVLVSFPRTGSHWLRMIIELYFERPLLTRTFYFHERKDYLLLHTHDMELDVRRENVIYLYRDPVDTIYSQLNYYREDINDRERIKHWTELYGRHLSKWLHEEDFTLEKSVLTYERLKKDLTKEFKKITDHFNWPFDELKIKKASVEVTKEKVKGKTLHDRQVVALNDEYGENRELFRSEHSGFVWQTLLSGREYLKKDF